MKSKQFIFKKFGSLLLMALSLFATNSCLQEIDLQPNDEADGLLVIQGKLSIADSGFVQVYISRTFGFKKTTGPKDVLHATVTLTDDAGNEMDIPGGMLDGYYRLGFDPDTPPIQITPGTKYQLKVKTPDNKEYVSTPEELARLPISQGIRIVRKEKEFETTTGSIQQKPVLELMISTPLEAIPGEGNKKLIWEVTSNYKLTDTPNGCQWEDTIPHIKTCYIQSLENIEENLFFDGQQSSLTELTDFILFDQLITYKFAEGCYFTVVQQSLNSDAFKYFQNTQELLSRTGSMFDPLPGNLRGNFRNTSDESEQVFGYFYPTMEDTLRIYVSPDMADFPETNCPRNLPDALSAPNQCCDCLLAPGSSLTKPFYWEF